LIGHLPRKQNNGKGMLFSAEQKYVKRNEKRANQKTPAWEATIADAPKDFWSVNF